MRRRTGAVAVVPLTTLLAVLVPQPALAAPDRVLFRITDPRIDEASGIALGRVSPDVFYVQNDSGDRSRFFALDRRSGVTRAVIEVPDVRNDDWEDIAVAPDRAGRSSVWLADTGDNRADRDEIQVIRVDEPVIGTDDHIMSAEPEVWHLRYPDRPVDAESLAVGPDGTAYLITKSLLGDSVVYRLPVESSPKVQTLERVATVTFAPTGSPGGPAGLIGQVTATGASLSRDGTMLAIRTYTDAYLWRVEGGDVATALRAAPRRIRLPRERQGEGIAVLPDELIVDSEGVGEPAYAVPVPQLGPGSSSPVGAGPTPATNSSRSTTRDATAGAALLDRGDQMDSGRPAIPIAISVSAAVLTALIWSVAAARRRRAR